MTVRMLIAALVAAVAMFLVGFLWFAVSPLPSLVWRPVPAEEEVIPMLSEHLEDSGVYLYPMPRETDDKAAEWERVGRLQRSGPLVHIVMRKEGADPMSPGTMGLGFVHYLVGALLLAVIIGHLDSATFGPRAALGVTVALFASWAMHMGDPIWMNFTWDEPLMNFVYNTVAWGVGAVIIAAIVRHDAPAGDTDAAPAA